MISRSRVLFVVNGVAQYREFKKVFQSKIITSKIDPLILFDRGECDPVDFYKNEIEDCRLSGYNFTFLPDPSKNNSRTIIRLLQIIIYILDKMSVRRPLRYLFFTKQISSFFRYVLLFKIIRSKLKNKIYLLRSFLIDEKIDSIVLGEENVLIDTFIYKKSFAKGKVVVYPYTIPNPKEMYGGAAQSHNLKSWKGCFFKFFGGRFVRVFNDQVGLLLSPGKIILLYSLGYQPSNPWVLNDDTADLVLVESPQMADIYTKLKAKPSRLMIMGSLNDDRLVEISKQRDNFKLKFQQKYNLPINKPIVLVGFPPNQFPLASAEFSNYQNLIETFKQVLSPFIKDYSIIITKHPRTKESLQQFSEAGFHVVDEFTLDLIPLSYIYIASISATIRWAIAAGVPVINYDTYRYRYDDYNKAKAVRAVYSASEFKNEVDCMLTNASHYSALKAQQENDSAYWGVLDGQVANRLADLLSNYHHKGLQ